VLERSGSYAVPPVWIGCQQVLIAHEVTAQGLILHHCRKLLALCDHHIRLCPPGDALNRVNIADQRGGIAVTVYLLRLNGIIEAQDVMNAHTLPRVKRPNRDNFMVVYPTEPK